jgi:hypothetical protein
MVVAQNIHRSHFHKNKTSPLVSDRSINNEVKKSFSSELRRTCLDVLAIRSSYPMFGD